jgi:hypothetical protein
MRSDDNVKRLLGVVPNNPRPAGHDEPPAPPSTDDAAYQSWLRRRIATLENQQRERVQQVEQKKRELDAVVASKQAEIETLKNQRTIGVVE